MIRGVNSSKGFTLIELMMAMAFVSVLLLVIAMTVIQISNIYNKGLTMKAVDQAGRSLSTDIRQTLSASQPFSVATAFKPQHPDGNSVDTAGGRLCTGLYTYVWNLGNFMANPVNKYSGSTKNTIRFTRVQDPSGFYCTNQGLVTAIPEKNATELVSTDGANLAIQSFNITQLENDATIGQALYRVVMEIGTNDSGTLQQNTALDTIDTNCKPPSDVSSLQDFCAVNQFDFTAQAGNKGEQ